MQKRWLLLLLPLPLLAAGCSGDVKFVPVSGRITANGKPLANVRVQFRPIGSDNPGPTSVGDTDADGRYTLMVASQKYNGKGAVPGKHSVSIGSILPGEGAKPTDPSVGSEDGEPLSGNELIPEIYNQNSILETVVPDKGTTEANFDLDLNRK